LNSEDGDNKHTKKKYHRKFPARFDRLPEQFHTKTNKSITGPNLVYGERFRTEANFRKLG